MVVPQLQTEQFCATIVLLGESNVGKSCLLNAFLEAPLAVVHRKRNMTRDRMRAVLTHKSPRGDCQLVFEDTAGLCAEGEARSTSARRIRKESLAAVTEAGIALWVIDAARTKQTIEESLTLATPLLCEHPCAFVALNKVDLIADKGTLLPMAQQLGASGMFKEIFMLSAKLGHGIAAAREALLAALPRHAFLYAQEGDTRSQELIASEITRKFFYDNLHEELPYDVSIEPELLNAQTDGSLEISQCVSLARESQRRILLAHDARLLHKLKEEAQKSIAYRFKCDVHLSLNLKRARGASGCLAP